MVLQDPALALGDNLLTLLDLGVVKLFDPTAGRAHQVVVVLTFIELVDGLAAFKVAATQDAGLLELGQHPVHRGQPHIGAVFQQHPKNVFGRHVALLAFLEHVQNFQAGQRGLEAGIFEFFDIGHGCTLGREGAKGAKNPSRYNEAIISPQIASCPESSIAMPA